MKTAAEMRKITNDACAVEKAKRLEKARFFCEGIVDTTMETEAKKGNCGSGIIEVPADVSLQLVVDYLEARGFAVKQNTGCQIAVEW